MKNIMKCCTLCPRECKVDRTNNEIGLCGVSNKVKVARIAPHYYEEPPISGKNGSGAIFFSGCNLKCIYCQNYEISHEHKGKEITIEHLAEIMLKQQNEKKAENINLVTPTMYVYQIREAIKIARKRGLNIPIIYNTNGYERVETLKQLEGYIDVYLPDFKYSDNQIAKKYSSVNNYVQVVQNAIKEMYKQVGAPKFNKNGMITKGVMIRHLILPNHIQNTKDVLKWLKENIDEKVYINIMAQYFPTYLAKKYDTLNRKLTQKEYDEIEEYAWALGIENGYIQELGEHEEEYVPRFDLSE